MNIEVKKLTGVELLRKANSFTTGHESKMSLKSAYRAGHTTIRTQIFLVECYGVPQYVAYHLRTHFSLHMMAPEEYGWMKSKRTDKGGKDFRSICEDIAERVETVHVDELISQYNDEIGHDVALREDIGREIRELPSQFDRYAPTDFCFLISAEGLMTLARTRLCYKAVSKETREVVTAICELIEECDPDLYPHLVPPCVAKSVCSESSCCGYIKTEAFNKARSEYELLFPPKNLPNR